MVYLLSVVYYIYYLLQIQLSIAYDCQCGRPSDAIVSMRIVGGRRAEPHSFPWTVAILKYDRMHCGAALITNKHLLSAGHCFKWDDFRIMDVLIGLDNMNDLKDVERRNITQVVIHEHFTSSAVRDENDIAIATINKPIVFSDTIIPVCLPTPGQDFAERVATIVGWGRIGVDKQSSRVLLKASLKILTDEECMQSKLAPHLKPTMMCAFSKGKDGCQGDSGGPLLVFETSGKYVQAGVVSWGIGCADPRYPGVYTKVSNYIDWITRHTSNATTPRATRRRRPHRLPNYLRETPLPREQEHRLMQQQMKIELDQERHRTKKIRHYKKHGRKKYVYSRRNNDRSDSDSVVDYDILDSQ